jgi:hypothetical protein
VEGETVMKGKNGCDEKEENAKGKENRVMNSRII